METLGWQPYRGRGDSWNILKSWPQSTRLDFGASFDLIFVLDCLEKDSRKTEEQDIRRAVQPGEAKAHGGAEKCQNTSKAK